jgi:hypothetical protein
LWLVWVALLASDSGSAVGTQEVQTSDAVVPLVTDIRVLPNVTVSFTDRGQQVIFEALAF